MPGGQCHALPLCKLRAREWRVGPPAGPGFGYAFRGGVPRHVCGDIESRERFQPGSDITGQQHPFLQVLDLLALRSRLRRPFSGDHPVLPGRRVLP